MSFSALAATNWRAHAPLISTCPVGLEVRIQIPQHPLALLAVLEHRGPFSAKTNFVQPVSDRKCGYQQRERRHCQRPRLVPEESSHNAENVCRKFAVTSMQALNSSAACPQPGEKFIHGLRPWHFRIRMSDPGDRV